MDLDTIIKKVRKCLDENSVVTDLDSTDADALELDEIIEDKIEQAINDVRMMAPLSRLDISSDTQLAPLPDGYLRFVNITDTNAANAVTMSITELSQDTDAVIRRNLSEFAGIRNTKKHPAAIYTKDGIVAYPPAATGETRKLYYIPAAELNDDNEYDIEEKIEDAVILKCAALVCGTQMNANGMQMMNAMCQENLGITNDK